VTKKKLDIHGLNTVPPEHREKVREVLEELFSDFFDPDKLPPGVVVDLEDKEVRCMMPECAGDLKQEPSFALDDEIVEYYTCSKCERPYMRKAKN